MDQINSYILGISLFLLIIFFISSDALLFSCHRIGLLLSL